MVSDFKKSIPLDRRSITAGLALWLAGSRPALPASTMAAQGFTSNRLEVVRRGALGVKGRDIILIPGLAAGPSIWQGLLAQLPGHRLHLVHISGFAGRPPGANGTGPVLRPVTDELARYMLSMPLRSPVIIGHSMGGTIAMMLGLRRDLGIGRLMVVDMLPEGAAMLGGTQAGFGYLAEQLNGYFTGTKAGRQILANMVAQTPGAEGSDPEVIAQALTELARTDLTQRLAALACPLEVIYALPADPQMAAARKQRFRAAYAWAARATLSGIGPSGHMIMFDQAVKFAAAVRAFVAL